MKLRLHGGSLRLRLGPGEVNALMDGQSVTEVISFGPDLCQQLRYVIESDEAIGQPRADFAENAIIVRVPAAMVRRWGGTEQVAIEALQPADRGQVLQILIEKDFACLHGQSATEDVFPNPLETA